MNQMAALPDFHENVVGTRKLFHQASPTGLPSGHVVAVKNATIGISDLRGVCLFVSDGACGVPDPPSREGKEGEVFALPR